MTKIFIIILNWNRYQDTHDCLKSLEKINKKNLDLNILVVDNGSKVEEIEKLKKIVPANSLILNNKNLGFAQGNNVGIRQALKNNADYVLVLNNDTFLDKNFLTELVSTAQKDKKIGALTSKIYFAKGYEFHKDRYKKSQTGKVIWSAGGAIDWNNIY
ncbi:glycosyltransferase family 2 protein, partial [Candidatus Woesebacteria bacterium]|nr:glycosyltransferase family 2 protein [Candidatus Woesebacteria bacterium]